MTPTCVFSFLLRAKSERNALRFLYEVRLAIRYLDKTVYPEFIDFCHQQWDENAQVRCKAREAIYFWRNPLERQTEAEDASAQSELDLCEQDSVAIPEPTASTDQLGVPVQPQATLSSSTKARPSEYIARRYAACASQKDMQLLSPSCALSKIARPLRYQSHIQDDVMRRIAEIVFTAFPEGTPSLLPSRANAVILYGNRSPLDPSCASREAKALRFSYRAAPYNAHDRVFMIRTGDDLHSHSAKLIYVFTVVAHMIDANGKLEFDPYVLHRLPTHLVAYITFYVTPTGIVYPRIAVGDRSYVMSSNSAVAEPSNTEAEVPGTLETCAEEETKISSQDDLDGRTHSSPVPSS